MRSLPVQHYDQITSVAYDFYGLRLATCSVDHTIKVFDRVGSGWELNDSWRAHEAAVVKVSWAGPLHAPLLASASHDCTVKLWDEVPEEPCNSGRRWRRKHTISDFRGPLYDVEFCANGVALKLAAIASDGVLRVYEAIDANNLSSWAAMVEVPLLNRPVSRQLQSSFSISWSPTPSFPDWIAVSVLDDALLFRPEVNTGKYVRVADLPGHAGLIRDIAWAPSFGRSRGLVATACKDGKVRIFSLKLREQPRALDTENESKPVQGFAPLEEQQPAVDDQVDILLVHESADHGGEVWRVTWNASGTVLASTGDDARVQFWKYMGGFKCVAIVDGHFAEQNVGIASN